MNRLEVGFGSAVITPPNFKQGVALGGYSHPERIAHEVNDDLNATALMLKQGEETAMIIVLDWLAVHAPAVQAIRAAVAAELNIQPEHIIVAATHTHSAPNTMTAWGWGEADREYIAGQIPHVVAACRMAESGLTAVRAGVACGRSKIGVNRYTLTLDGDYTYGQSPDDFMGSDYWQMHCNDYSYEANETAAYDDRMTVIKFVAESGTVGTLIHCGAHPTCMGGTAVISRDWCGVMRDRVAAVTKAPVIFLNGAIGDVGPRSNFLLETGKFSAAGGDGIDAVREVGYRGASEALRLFCRIDEFHDDWSLTVKCEAQKYLHEPLADLALARRRADELYPRRAEGGVYTAEYRYYRAVIEAHKLPAQPDRTLEQTVIAIGPVAIVPMPGEIFSEITLRLRSYSPYGHTLCVSAANDFWGYLVPQSARFRPNYSVWMELAFGAYKPAHDIDDQLISNAMRLLQRPAANPNH